MIGMLSRTGLLDGMKLSRYHYKVALNCRNYVSRSPLSLLKRLPSEQNIRRNFEPVSRTVLKKQQSDGIPLGYEIIYNSFEYHTISQYYFAAMSGLYIIFGSLLAITKIEYVFSDLITAAQHLWVSGIFLYCSIGTSIISYKSPVRIYHNKETGDYTAIFNAFKPFNIRKLEFRKGMVERIPPPDRLTLFRFCRYRIKDQDLYMFDTYFRFPADLYNMLDETAMEE